MWRSTRMVVLTAISAALYAAALIAFKFLSILPGVTEIRPGVALVVLCSLLFGPAGAWGAAIGNTVGDLAGGLGPGTAVGFVANLLFGMIPYKMYRAFAIEDPTPTSAGRSALLVLVCLVASIACGVVVGFGIQAVGLWPIAFKVLANTIAATNAIVCVALVPFLVKATYPRVAAQGLRWQDILDVRPPRRSASGIALGAAIAVLVFLMLALGDAHELGLLPRFMTPIYVDDGPIPWTPPPPPALVSLESLILSPLVLLVIALALVD